MRWTLTAIAKPEASLEEKMTSQSAATAAAFAGIANTAAAATFDFESAAFTIASADAAITDATVNVPVPLDLC